MNKDTNIFPWGDRRPYNSFAARMKEKYGGRIQKVSVNAGFTCPNRDGTRGKGGCVYCDNRSFTPSYCVEDETISEQIDKGLIFLKKRYKKTKHFIAYFQSYSNTYKPLNELEIIYEEALFHPEIDGLAISTRPDCVDEEIMDYLSFLNERYFIFLEYGIESCYNTTLEKINRGHTFEETINAVQLSRSKNIHTTGHLLFGLPEETREEMLEEASIVSELPLDALKFHQLQIIKDTHLGRQYQNNPEDFLLFSFEDYIDFIIKFLERLNPAIAVERLSGETPPKYRLNPGWGNIRPDSVKKKIESVMEERGTWHGKQFKK